MKIKKYFVGFIASTMLVSTCYCIKPVEAIDFSKDELNELWKIYKEEFNSASNEDKNMLSYRDNDIYNNYNKWHDIWNF